MLEGVEQSKSVAFGRVIYALSIPYVGETVAKKLAKSVRDIDTLISMSAEALTEIDDIGPRIAESIVDFFSHQSNREIVERLRQAGLQMASESTQSAGSDRLAGKSIVISGTFTHNSRDRYKEIIEENGGKNVGSISKKTDFILAGDNMGPAKLEKARKLSIPILSEDEFLAMLKSENS